MSVPATDFLMGETLSNGTDVQLRLNVVIPTGETAIPYLRVSNVPADEVESVLGTDPDVRMVDVLQRDDDGALTRIEWHPTTARLLERIVESKAILVDAKGRNGSWSLRLNFPDQSQLAEFYRQCVEEGITVTLESISHGGVDGSGDHRSLTELQLETLRTALEAGYFEVPRRATLVDIAEELGVSDSAVSQRLRRGLGTLLEASLDGDPGKER